MAFKVEDMSKWHGSDNETGCTENGCEKRQPAVQTFGWRRFASALEC